MRIAFRLLIILLIPSCKSKEEKILINGNNDLWRVVQDGQYRSDSSLKFFKLNSDNTFTELYSNPDILNWHKWEQVNDTIFKFAYIDHRIVTLTDSIALFGNIKRPQDTLALLRVKIHSGAFTSYR